MIGGGASASTNRRKIRRHTARSKPTADHDGVTHQTHRGSAMVAETMSGFLPSSWMANQADEPVNQKNTSINKTSRKAVALNQSKIPANRTKLKRNGDDDDDEFFDASANQLSKKSLMVSQAASTGTEKKKTTKRSGNDNCASEFFDASTKQTLRKSVASQAKSPVTKTKKTKTNDSVTHRIARGSAMVTDTMSGFLPSSWMANQADEPVNQKNASTGKISRKSVAVNQDKTKEIRKTPTREGDDEFFDASTNHLSKKSLMMSQTTSTGTEKKKTTKHSGNDNDESEFFDSLTKQAPRTSVASQAKSPVTKTKKTKTTKYSGNENDESEFFDALTQQTSRKSAVSQSKPSVTKNMKKNHKVGSRAYSKTRPDEPKRRLEHELYMYQLMKSTNADISPKKKFLLEDNGISLISDTGISYNSSYFRLFVTCLLMTIMAYFVLCAKSNDYLHFA